MWQRIQMVYLILSVVLLSLIPAFQFPLTFNQPFYWGGMIVAAVSMILAIWGIAQFQNRKQQMSTVRMAAITALLAVGCAKVVYLLTTPQAQWMTFTQNPAILWGIGGAFLGFIFQLLALRAIRKDESLVRSMDRLR